MRVALVSNSASRSASEACAPFEQRLKESGVEVVYSHLAESPEDFLQALEHSKSLAPDVVAVGGGDGSLGMAAALLKNTGLTMAVVPLGTGNQFAKELGINDLEAAYRAITCGETFACDVAGVNGVPFVTVATIGLSASVARNLFGKKLIGKLAYIPAWVKALARAEPFVYTATADNRPLQGTAIQFVVGNGRSHAGPLWTHSQASLTDGFLNGYIVGPVNPVQGLGAAGLALIGQQALLKDVEGFKAKELRLNVDPSLPLVVDGEITYHDALLFTVEPGALLLRKPGLVAEDEPGSN